MKYKTSILTGVAALGLLAASTKTTQAGSFSFGITLGGCNPRVVVQAPLPPIVIPAPPRVVVHAPPPVVYYAPRPVIYHPAPPVVYYQHGHPNPVYQRQHKAYHHQLKHLRKDRGFAASYRGPVAYQGRH